MNNNRKKVVNYYQNPESRWGYTFLTWDTKHFGYYPFQNSHITERKAQELMMDLLAKKLDLKKADLVLDAGCGRGTTSCYLGKKYRSKLIGIDIVPFEVEIAKRKAKELGLTKQVKFYLQDYSKISFPNNYFDKIFTLETLVHSPNIKKTLREFHRILKPDGKIVLFEYSRSKDIEFNQWEKKMFDLICKESAMTSFFTMFHHTLPKNIKSAGFKILSDQDITEHMLPSLKRFYNYAIIPYQIIKLLHLQKYFINTTAAVEYHNTIKKGLGRYRIFVAEKK